MKKVLSYRVVIDEFVGDQAVICIRSCRWSNFTALRLARSYFLDCVKSFDKTQFFTDSPFIHVKLLKEVELDKFIQIDGYTKHF